MTPRAIRTIIQIVLNPEITKRPHVCRSVCFALFMLCFTAAAADSGTNRPHWAFIAPTRPAIPAVKNNRWARNPIDRFVLARLEQEKLKPSPQADKATFDRAAAEHRRAGRLYRR
jgi:hypothetical protein